MPRHHDYLPHGVIPAVLLPFHDDLSIDERSYRAHLRDVASGRGHLGADHQRPRVRSRLLHLRRATARARDHAGRGRRPRAHRQRHLRGGQPGSGAPRQDGARRRRLRAAGVSVRRVHLRPAAGDGGGALQAHRRCHRPAAHRVPVPARRRPGLSACHAAQDHRGGAQRSRHQGLVHQPAVARAADPHAAGAPAAGHRAHHPQRLAVQLPRARLQWLAVRQRLGDRRPPGPACSAPCRAATSPPPARFTIASGRPSKCSTPSLGSTCTIE